ncbi:pentatricopeptide repeat-containing protein At1g31430-like [Salvia splendens]|uniref:pentatricopeptide repeat-containing protein At1g31430-like n=1 Tax=Salvia splendens TaxID=180675 RepID=UPI001C276015|nr:pentatricopeptide repeat-containing protein At1g31430-like [Salvia splendens]XP_042002658.1 pentatricopeptide repeat-containing protein At1g31430-like [Salvia splendens]
MLLRSLLRVTAGPASPFRQSQWQLTYCRSMALETSKGGSSKAEKPQPKFDKKAQSKPDLKDKKPEQVLATILESISRQDVELRRRLPLDVPRHGLPLFTSAPSLSLLTDNDVNLYSNSEVSSLLTKKACIDLIKKCKSMTCFKQIQAQVFTHGLHSNIDVLHKLMAFATDADLSYADIIFAQIELPTLFIYNVMIKAHVKSSSCRKALSLFDELRHKGLVPDNYTYPFVFKAVGKLRMVPEGEKLHGFALKSGDLHDCYVCNSVLDLYRELGCVQNLAKVFDEIPTRDLISWNVLISGFVKSSRFEEAVNVYRRIRLETSLQPDEATIVSTLSACTPLKNLDLGREIHEYVSKKLGFTMIIGNALMDMYAKCGCVEIARGIFDAMPEKNVICWTSMVSAYTNLGCLDEARALFDRSSVKDLVLWTTMINGYVQFNMVDEAMTLFRSMQMKGIEPDKYTLVTLLTGCAQLRALEQGEWIHAYLKEIGIIIDAVVGTALMEMYAKCGCLEKSLQIFYQLNQKDAASWTSMICALAMNGDAKKAVQLFTEMTQVGIRPDDVTFVGVLSACSHGGLVEEGRKHFDSMTKVYQLEPKLEHYGCLIDLLGRAGLMEDAEQIIREIPNQDNNFVIPLYGALLSACRNYENVEIGERIAKKLLEVESSDSSAHTLLTNIYAAANRWEDVKKVRRKMDTMGSKKFPGCSALDVGVGGIY